jgi:hypothetical protein
MGYIVFCSHNLMQRCCSIYSSLLFPFHIRFAGCTNKDIQIRQRRRRGLWRRIESEGSSIVMERVSEWVSHGKDLYISYIIITYACCSVLFCCFSWNKWTKFLLRRRSRCSHQWCWYTHIFLAGHPLSISTLALPYCHQ